MAAMSQKDRSAMAKEHFEKVYRQNQKITINLPEPIFTSGDAHTLPVHETNTSDNWMSIFTPLDVTIPANGLIEYHSPVSAVSSPTINAGPIDEIALDKSTWKDKLTFMGRQGSISSNVNVTVSQNAQ